MESAPVVSVVVVIIRALTDRVLGRVGLEVDIRGLDNPSIMRGGEVYSSVGGCLGCANIVSGNPPTISVDSRSLFVDVSININVYYLWKPNETNGLKKATI